MMRRSYYSPFAEQNLIKWIAYSHRSRNFAGTAELPVGQDVSRYCITET
jgi:hypothetical protein